MIQQFFCLLESNSNWINCKQYYKLNGNKSNDSVDAIPIKTKSPLGIGKNSEDYTEILI